jgi:hypothetical protein
MATTKTCAMGEVDDGGEVGDVGEVGEVGDVVSRVASRMDASRIGLADPPPHPASQATSAPPAIPIPRT